MSAAKLLVKIKYLLRKCASPYLSKSFFSDNQNPMRVPTIPPPEKPRIKGAFTIAVTVMPMVMAVPED